MKTTIDIPDSIYRKVKAKSAMEGHAVRDIAITLFTEWVEKQDLDGHDSINKPDDSAQQSTPEWFGSMRKYSANARGKYDMTDIRRSIAHKRRTEESE